MRPGYRYLHLQGVAMGRASRIHIAVEVHEGAIDAVRVGGQAVLFATGTTHLPLN